MTDKEENVVSDPEIQEEWKQRRQNQSNDEQDICKLKSPASNTRPIDPRTGQYLSYEDMKSRFLTAQGRGSGWQTPDTTDHDITAPRPSENIKPSQSYEQMKKLWYEKQGKRSPDEMRAKWSKRL
jgi:hypothetical protein